MPETGDTPQFQPKPEQSLVKKFGQKAKAPLLAATAAVATAGAAFGVFKAAEGGFGAGKTSDGSVKTERTLEGGQMPSQTAVAENPDNDNKSTAEISDLIRAAFKGKSFEKLSDEINNEQVVLARFKNCENVGQPFTVHGSDYALSFNVDNPSYGLAILGECEKVAQAFSGVYHETGDAKTKEGLIKFFAFNKDTVDRVKGLGFEIGDGYFERLLDRTYRPVLGADFGKAPVSDVRQM